MKKINKRVSLLSLLIAGGIGATQVTFGLDGARAAALERSSHGDSASFRRASTLANYLNNKPKKIGEETVSEIIAATHDGMTLVYTDSPCETARASSLALLTLPIPPIPNRLG